MADRLDQRVLDLIERPELAVEETDLTAALTAITRRQPNAYRGRRDLFALEKRLVRLTGQPCVAAAVMDRWQMALEPDRETPDEPAAPLFFAAEKPLPAAHEETLDDRVIRLLTVPSPRRPDDLDLADAIVAVLWRQARAYRGAFDIWQVERAIESYRSRPVTISSVAVTRLASREFLDEAAGLPPGQS